jgi:hypothetical protein
LSRTASSAGDVDGSSLSSRSGRSTDRGWQVGGKLFYRVLAKVSGGKRVLVADRLESLTLARRLAHWLEPELKALR